MYTIEEQMNARTGVETGLNQKPKHKHIAFVTMGIRGDILLVGVTVAIG